MKSEPDEFSIDDLAAAKSRTTPWFGVRNYQARNFMRDQMRLGDRAFFYHSSCPEPGIAGIVEVSALAYPDETQFDRKNPHYDPKSTRDAPRWVNVDVKFVEKTRLIGLPELRSHPARACVSCGATGFPSPRSTRPSGLSSRSSPSASHEGVDPALIVAFVVLGALVGFLAGLLGIGGGMTMVPMLTIAFSYLGFAAEHVVHLAVATATATILFTSASSSWAHHRHGAVLWNVVARMAPGMIVGSLADRSWSAGCRRRSALRRFLRRLVAVAATNVLLDRKPKLTRELPGTMGLSAVGRQSGLSRAWWARAARSTVPFLIACNVALRTAWRRRRRLIAGWRSQAPSAVIAPVRRRAGWAAVVRRHVYPPALLADRRGQRRQRAGRSALRTGGPSIGCGGSCDAAPIRSPRTCCGRRGVGVTPSTGR